MSTYRGYYEGLNNMFPTAISQVLESLGKLVFGLSLAYVVIDYGTKQVAETGTVFGIEVKTEADAAIIYALAAAAAVFGVTLGTVAGTIYVVLRHKFKKDGITKEGYNDYINLLTEEMSRNDHLMKKGKTIIIIEHDK
jgi:stage V sporulation protein B